MRSVARSYSSNKLIPGVQGLDPRRRTPNTPPFARAQRFNPGGDSSHAPTTLKNRILIPGGMDLMVTWNTQIPFSFSNPFFDVLHNTTNLCVFH